MRSGTAREGGEVCGDALRGEKLAASDCGAERLRAESAPLEAMSAELTETSEFERGTVETISGTAQGSGWEASLLPAEEAGAVA